jgi:hypothetical protein
MKLGEFFYNNTFHIAYTSGFTKVLYYSINPYHMKIMINPINAVTEKTERMVKKNFMGALFQFIYKLVAGAF